VCFIVGLLVLVLREIGGGGWDVGYGKLYKRNLI